MWFSNVVVFRGKRERRRTVRGNLEMVSQVRNENEKNDKEKREILRKGKREGEDVFPDVFRFMLEVRGESNQSTTQNEPLIIASKDSQNSLSVIHQRGLLVKSSGLKVKVVVLGCWWPERCIDRGEE